MGLVTASNNEISRSRANSASGNNETPRSKMAEQFSGAEPVIETRHEPKEPAKGLLGRMGTYFRKVSGKKAPHTSEPAAAKPVTPEEIRSSDSQVQNPPAADPVVVSASHNDSANDPAASVEPGSVFEGPAMEQLNTAVKEIAAEAENAEDDGENIAGDEVTAEPKPVRYGEISFTDEELLEELDAGDMPEANDVAAGPKSTGNDAAAALWERTVDGELADLSDIAGELTDADDKFASLNLWDENLEVDPLALDMLDNDAQDATRRWSAASNPTGGPAAGAQPAPSSAVGNSTCASQFDARALKISFALGGPEQAGRLLRIFAESKNDYAKVIVVGFAKLLTLSFRKILDDGNLSLQEKNSHVAKLKSLAKEYISLIESEGLDKKSPFGAFYLGQKDARNQRMNLEDELVALSGGKNAEGGKTLRDLLIKRTVQPFIDAHLKKMFGGQITSLTQDMVDARAKEVLAKIGVAAENYSKNHHGGASVRGLAFGFSLVTLWPELLRKLLDDDASAAAQAQNPTPAPSENGDPLPSSLPPAPVGGPPNPTPAGSPEPAIPDEHNSGAGGGTVINIGSIHIDKRSNYNNDNRNITFGHDDAGLSMGPEDDGSDASSESGYSPLTEANLAAHDRLFSEGIIAPPPTLKTSESDSETSESDSEDRHSISGDSYASRDSALEGNFITHNPRQPKPADDSLQQPASLSPSLSGDEVDSGIFARRIIEDRSDQGESVAQSLNETSDGNTSSESSGYDSDAKQSEPASRHEISTSTPFPPGSYTFQSALLPFAQGASAIEFVNLDRAAVTNGWAPTVNDDGKQSWKQMLMDKSGELKASEFKKVELTINRDVEGRSGGVKPGARVLPHPWARSQWIRETAAKRMQAENTLMVEEAADAAKPVGQPDFAEQNADAA
jgi:hypothetical protein